MEFAKILTHVDKNKKEYLAKAIEANRSKFADKMKQATPRNKGVKK